MFGADITWQYDGSMTNFAQTFKQEIARIARREVREDIAGLRKASSSYRSEIAALKRSVKDLQTQLRAAGKNGVGSNPVQVRVGVSRGPGRKAAFSAERLKAKRQALGLSQAQMAVLLGVSSLSVWKWESGQVTPRASRLARYFEVLTMGKRDALRHLAAM